MNCLTCNTPLDTAPVCFHGYHSQCFINEARSDNTCVCPFCDTAVIKNSHTVAAGKQKFKEVIVVLEPVMKSYIEMTDDRDKFLSHKEEVLQYIETVYSLLNALKLLYTKKDLNTKALALMYRALVLVEQANVLKDNLERSYEDHVAYKQFAKMLDSNL